MWKCPECSAMISHGGTCCGKPVGVEQDEPVAWVVETELDSLITDIEPNGLPADVKVTPLYTRPATDERLRAALEKIANLKYYSIGSGLIEAQEIARTTLTGSRLNA